MSIDWEKQAESLLEQDPLYQTDYDDELMDKLIFLSAMAVGISGYHRAKDLGLTEGQMAGSSTKALEAMLRGIARVAHELKEQYPDTYQDLFSSIQRWREESK
jgi:hypothetical protein